VTVLSHLAMVRPGTRGYVPLGATTTEGIDHEY
jgi:hypothetical protein